MNESGKRNRFSEFGESQSSIFLRGLRFQLESGTFMLIRVISTNVLCRGVWEEKTKVTHNTSAKWSDRPEHQTLVCVCVE